MHIPFGLRETIRVSLFHDSLPPRDKLLPAPTHADLESHELSSAILIQCPQYADPSLCFSGRAIYGKIVGALLLLRFPCGTYLLAAATLPLQECNVLRRSLSKGLLVHAHAPVHVEICGACASTSAGSSRYPDTFSEIRSVLLSKCSQ